MNSSKSSPKRAGKNSFKPVSPYDMFYQITYMSAMAAAGISRSKMFEMAEQSHGGVAVYFAAVNTLVNEFRYDYPEACRSIGVKAKSDNIKTFLLRLSDALHSGEPVADYLARESEVQSEEYKNEYERKLETLKQWSNAFSSIMISVALIVIIQMVSSMIYSTGVGMMSGLVATGVILSGFGTWIIYRSAPQEKMNVALSQGSPEQRRARSLFRTVLPLAVMAASILLLLNVSIGWILMGLAVCLLPIGFFSLMSDKQRIKKDVEFSTFLRSVGGMASSSGTTTKQALTKIDLSSFPMLRTDIERLSKRLHARLEPEICWHQFGLESGSLLINEVTDVFYGAIKIGGDPERVGYLCSIFSARVTQLRAKRRLTSSTFSGLTTVMQTVVAGLLVFVLSIIINFVAMVESLVTTDADSAMAGQRIQLTIGQMSASDLQFLTVVTGIMVVSVSIASAVAIILCDGGLKLKVFFYLSMTAFISSICFLVVPSMVSGILSA
ncbi:MAG: archaellar assembly protein FlaJ [Anaerolineae bacterium]|nr:archaellar assembly protein FlaJ [Anaerolineae bacterium]